MSISGGIYRRTYKNVPFVTMWRIPVGGETVILPMSGTHDVTIDWGDGVIEDNVVMINPTHTYAAVGDYNISINGSCDNWAFDNTGQREKIIGISQWGNLQGMHDWSNAFFGCFNLETVTATDSPTAPVSFDSMFLACTALVMPPETGWWDTRTLRTTAHMFDGCSSMIEAPDTRNWFTAALLNTNHMFSTCGVMATAPSVETWVTNQIADMSHMFADCSAMTETPDVSGWDTSGATNMTSWMRGCSALTIEPDVEFWATQNVVSMASMFSNCSGLVNPPNTSDWVLSSVTNTFSMFKGCAAMTVAPDTSRWNVARVSNMGSMFEGCTLMVNPPITSTWNTGTVNNMAAMFKNCLGMLDSPTSISWVTSQVTNTREMFRNCSNMVEFEVQNWNIRNLVDATSMFEGSSLASADYNVLLLGWAGQAVKSGVPFHAGTAQYNGAGSVASAHNTLTNAPNNWVIMDGGPI